MLKSSATITELGNVRITKKGVDSLKSKARVWREHHDFIGKGGLIIFYKRKAVAWLAVLSEPERWEPGCIALDDQGRLWVTAGGDPQNGAKRWEPVALSEKVVRKAPSVFCRFMYPCSATCRVGGQPFMCAGKLPFLATWKARTETTT